MTRYIIKVVCEATEKNDNFYGEIHTHYEGKNHSYETDNGRLKWFAKEYGFTTKAAALQGLKSANDLAEWETARGYWIDRCELVEVEV